MTRLTSFLLTVLSLTGCDAIKNPPRPLSKSAKVGMYIVSPTSTPGTIQGVDPATQTAIHLITPPIITETDVATIQRTEEPQEVTSLTWNLTPAGAKKFAAATATSTGMRIAFVVNGKVIAAPVIRSQLSTGFQVSGAGIDDELIEYLSQHP